MRTARPTSQAASSCGADVPSGASVLSRCPWVVARLGAQRRLLPRRKAGKARVCVCPVFGPRAGAVVDRCLTDDTLRQPMVPGYDLRLGELVFTMRYERAQDRRSPVGANSTLPLLPLVDVPGAGPDRIEAG